MSDQIFVSGLVVHAHHGVMEHESKVGQRFVLDLELSIDLKDAARSDKLVDTVSYSAIVETASRAFTGQSYRLVETAAGAVADALLGGFGRVELGARDGAQAACADRRDLRRCRGHAGSLPRRQARTPVSTYISEHA